jgi:Fe-S-cluster-containing dehydrogenase component
MENVLTADVQRCIGCRTCEMACTLRRRPSVCPAGARLSVVRLEDRGLHLPQLCRQCADPFCAAVCPVDALVRDEGTGAVLLVDERCVGCRLCVQACPFGAMSVDPETEEIIKCDLCGGNPACVESCPAEALHFEPPTRPAARKRRLQAAKMAEALSDEDPPSNDA